MSRFCLNRSDVLSWILALMFVVLSTWSQSGEGQEVPLQDKSGPAVTREQFDKTVQQWRDTYKDSLQAIIEFRSCPEEDAERLQNKIEQLRIQGDQLAGQAIQEAAALYKRSNVSAPDLRNLLSDLPKRYFDGHNYEKSFIVGDALLSHDPTNQAVLAQTALSAFFSNQFDEADRLIEQIKKVTGITDVSLLPTYAADIPKYQAQWKRETELRQKEAAADDLPRIEIETTRGKIVFELFENEAYESVNNLVHLAETDYFRNMTFWEVLEHQFASTGCPFNNGTGGPDYGVRSEAREPEARKHFRGSVGMFVNQQDQTVGSQFYFCRIPIPEMDGTNVVVGRVIEGMDVVDGLTTTHKFDPNGIEAMPIEDVAADRMISIKVIRKRDHDYRPNKVAR